ncbi:MAG TPA: type IV pilin [Methanoregula sp.]|nr:type IV pilin [Methanoregula sp.]
MDIKGRICESGASEVVGEMLMIGLAIILISVFASVMGNFLPSAHDPVVTVMLTGDSRNVTFWHKGGDWVKTEELTVIIGNDSVRRSFTMRDAGFFQLPDKQVFDLGSNITVMTGSLFYGDETATLVTPRASLFSGKVRP